MTSPFLESSWKIKLGCKVKLYLASAVFELLLLIWAKAQIIPLTQKTVFFLLLLLFSTDFSRAYFSYSLAFIATKIHRNVGTIATWVAMIFCDVGYDRIWVISKKQDFTKNTTLRQYLLFFKSFFFILFTCPRQSPWSTSVTTYQSPFSN